MIVRNNAHETVLQCDGGDDFDGCLSVFYADTPELAEARLRAEAEGWKEGRDDADAVFDYCPKCAPKL
jgi:hypothetical protein